MEALFIERFSHKIHFLTPQGKNEESARKN